MILYVPRSSVIADLDFSMSAGLLASTVTPGKTAPVSSLTVPVNALCARASGASASKHTNEANTPMANGILMDFLIPLPPQKHSEVDFAIIGLPLLYKGARDWSRNKVLESAVA